MIMAREDGRKGVVLFGTGTQVTGLTPDERQKRLNEQLEKAFARTDEILAKAKQKQATFSYG
jgi:tRNA threonylcarbamoyladenosine modification (KEOPS) complex Cgi121 subunit